MFVVVVICDATVVAVDTVVVIGVAIVVVTLDCPSVVIVMIYAMFRLMSRVLSKVGAGLASVLLLSMVGWAVDGSVVDRDA